MPFGMEPGTAASWLAALVAAVAAIVTWRNVSRQIAAQEKAQEKLLDHQRTQDDRRWEREQDVRYGMQRLEAYGTFPRVADALALFGLFDRRGVQQEKVGEWTRERAIDDYTRSIALVDLLAPPKLRQCASNIEAVVASLHDPERWDGTPEEADALYSSLRPLRERFTETARTEYQAMTAEREKAAQAAQDAPGTPEPGEAATTPPDAPVSL